jgi:hypothetical protein
MLISFTMYDTVTQRRDFNKYTVWRGHVFEPKSTLFESGQRGEIGH